MKTKPNYLKHLLQWGTLLAIVATVLWAVRTESAVDVEKYCPFGGLQAFGTYLVNNSLACTMSMLQIMMGLVLAAGVILFSKLFCGYLCPLGTVGEALGRIGRKLHIQFDIRSGSVADRLLRAAKYVLLFVILYNTLATSELFCKRLDPYYAAATGFKGEIVLWMSLTSIVLLLLGNIFIKMFWCRYICPLGAASNIFRFTWLFLGITAVAYTLRWAGVEGISTWIVAAACAASYLLEAVTLQSRAVPIMHIVRSEEACNGCGLCSKRCPYGIDLSRCGKVKHIDCTLCTECVSACNTSALQLGRSKAPRWIPAVLAIALFAMAVWLGSTLELPTIDEKWGDYDKVENMQTYQMDGLQSVKCYGSSKAFSAKMQTVAGVYGVKTYVRRHGVVVSFDPSQTDTLKIQEAIFSPMIRKYATPTADVPVLNVVKLGVEGLHDRMDVVYFGMMLQKIEGIYGFTSQFACPVEVTVYIDPAVEISEKDFADVINVREFVIPAKDGDRSVPMHTELKSYALAGQASREEFAASMFGDVEALNGRFTDNNERWGDDEAFPKAVYELPLPGIEKPPVRRGFPYFKSYLSHKDGIMAVEFVLRDMVPTLRLHYVRDMWDDARIWSELFNAEKWTVYMVDGSSKEVEPQIEFPTEGATVDK